MYVFALDQTVPSGETYPLSEEFLDGAKTHYY